MNIRGLANLSLIIGILAALAMLTTGPAYAHSHGINNQKSAFCDAAVGDQGGLFNDASVVAAKVDQAYNDTGAIFKVRTFAGYEQVGVPAVTDIKSYVAYMISVCPSWRGVGQDLKSNYVILVLSVIADSGTADVWLGSDFSSQNSAIADVVKSNIGPNYLHPGRLALESYHYSEAKTDFQQGTTIWIDEAEQKISTSYWLSRNWGWVVFWLIVGIAILVVLVKGSSGGSSGTFIYTGGYYRSGSGGGSSSSGSSTGF